MLYSQFSSSECCSSQVRPLLVFVVLNVFYCEDHPFESIPRATLEHSKMQTVDNHIIHTTAPCAALSPIHSLWNVLIPVFVFFFFSIYLPWFLMLIVILIWACIFLPTDLMLNVEWCILRTCSLYSVAKPWLHQFSKGVLFLYEQKYTCTLRIIENML